jgi:arginase
MTGIDLVTIPYDSGQRGYRMGAGPQHLLHGELVRRLRTAGHDVELIPVEASGVGSDVEATTFDLAARAARVTRAGRSAGRFPVLLSGNCIQTIGVVAGCGRDDIGVLWLAAPGDLNTPATSPSGFLDGMGAAVLVGWCHEERARSLPLEKLAESRLLLIGTRALDPAEDAALRASSVSSLPGTAATDAGALGAALDRLFTSARSCYLHIDLDVLDPDAVGRANTYAAAGGLTVAQVQAVVAAAAERVPILGLTIASYDPSVDADDAVRKAGIELIMSVVQAVQAHPA